MKIGPNPETGDDEETPFHRAEAGARLPLEHALSRVWRLEHGLQRAHRNQRPAHHPAALVAHTIRRVTVVPPGHEIAVVGRIVHRCRRDLPTRTIAREIDRPEQTEPGAMPSLPEQLVLRSEERRVGKEGRCRW